MGQLVPLVKGSMAQQRGTACAALRSRQAAFWGALGLTLPWLCRPSGISLTPRVPFLLITCWTSSLASDPAPSPSPPPCW